MKVSLKWLQDYIDISLPVKELAEKLTMSGTEVGGVQLLGGQWEKIVVGQVVSLERHPNADRLLLATVDPGGEHLIVVTGAPNLKAGDKVPFAYVGARLIDGHTGEPTVLKSAKLRGVVSEGMVCSEKELGISDYHEGIMILPPEAPVGLPLSQYLGDTILDLKITPNRPDSLSVLGIAHEVVALTGKALRLPEVRYEEEGGPIEGKVAVEIADPDLCPRYCAALLTDVEVAPSPPWMQERLVASGLRPINNIVDITNYVMLEYGQPLHAFDYAKIKGGKIIVRRAREGEVLVTLDGVERKLGRDMLVIADAEGAGAVGGVIGGGPSEVSEETTSVLLEAANFNNVSIRRTAASLRLRTEASSRFEKGLSPELTPLALRRAAQLMVELGKAKAARGIIDVYPGKRERPAIPLTKERVRRVLGLELSLNRIAQVLASLGFRCQAAPEGLSVTVPYWRTDIKLADDLVEEVARIIGYEEFPTTLLGGQLPSQQPSPALALKERVRDILVGCGMQEVITYSLISREMFRKAMPQSPQPLRVANPMTAEQEYLRTTFRAGLLAALAANEKHEENALRLFEVGKVYLPRKKDLPEEREMVSGVLCGPRADLSWFPDQGRNDFFDAKGTVETLFERLGLEVAFQEGEDPILVPGRTARLVSAGTEVGLVGELHPRVASAFDISSLPVSLFEVDLEGIFSLLGPPHKYRPLPRFPSLVRDLALLVEEAVTSKRVQDIIQAHPLVNQVTLFDVYTGERVPPGKKSLAYRITYQSPTATLTEERVNKAQQEILERLAQELGASLRG